jgi:hypothetical protein
VAVLGLTAAFLWGAVGIHTTGDRINGFARLAVPGATTVSVTGPGTIVSYYKSAAEVAGSAEPRANARIAATRWDPGTQDHRHRGLCRPRPDLAAARAAGNRARRRGRAGGHLPVQRPLRPRSGRAGRALATFPATTRGPTRCRPPGPARPGPPWPWGTTSPVAWW